MKMIKLVTTEEIRKLEKEYIQELGSNGSLALMDKAGTGLAKVAKEYNDPFLIICGKGNNAGDGLVAARCLYEAGKRVAIFLTSQEKDLSHEAGINFELIKNKIPYLILENERDKRFYDALRNSNTIIECLLGTGTNKKLTPFFEWIIKTINSSKKAVIACDIPTGVDPDTGCVPQSAVMAEATITFGYPKLGLTVYPAKKYVGILRTVDIGLPDIRSNTYLLNDDFVKENLPKRLEDSSKGTYGKTLLVCGSKKYPGAALLASKAASTIGSGLTCLATVKDVFDQITSGIPEVIHSELNISSVLDESKKSSVIVVGPGLTSSGEAKVLVEDIIQKVNCPIVLDADGINVLAGKKVVIKSAKNDVVITPHLKEFARLLNLTIKEVQDNKIKLAKQTSRELACTVVLKGPATIIAFKNGELFISPFANAALAKGGTGDVLSGFIGGLIAQGLEPEIAACVGVYLHGKTAELVSKNKTVFSLLPQDLISYLPETIKLYL